MNSSAAMTSNPDGASPANVLRRNSVRLDMGHSRSLSLSDEKRKSFMDEDSYHQQYSVLLVFPKLSDAPCVALTEAVRQANLRLESVTSLDNAKAAFDRSQHNLVIIDSRNIRTFDALLVCKLLRNLPGSCYSVMISIRSQGAKEKSEDFFNSGFDQEMIETCQTNVCSAHLLYFTKRMNLLTKLRIAEAMYTAIQWVDEGVEIYDNQQRIQYVNQATVNMLGYLSPSELVGQDGNEMIVSKQNAPLQLIEIQHKLSIGEPWQGNFSIKKRTGESLMRFSRVVPLRTLEAQSQTMGSVAIRRFDISSCVMCTFNHERCRETFVKRSERRTSTVHFVSGVADSAVDHNIVFDVLTRIKRFSHPDEHPLIDRITYEMGLVHFRGAEVIRAVQRDNLIAGELLEGLMTAKDQTDDETAPVNRPRKSSDVHWVSSLDSSVGRSTIATANIDLNSAKLLLPLLGDETILEHLDLVLSWSFNVLKMEKLTKNKPLVYVGYTLFQHFEIMTVLKIDDKIALNWLELMESHYHSTLTYHNATHAADVAQACACFCCQDRLMEILDPLDRMVLIVSAIIHDLDHIGRTNPFLINSKHRLAILYNDISVLENHHASLAFRLMNSNNTANIFQNLDRELFRAVRQQVVDLVLATDMSRHFEHVNKFADHTQKLNFSVSLPRVTQPHGNYGKIEGTSDMTEVSSSQLVVSGEVRTAIKRMLIKCSDVSNPLRSIELGKVWADRISLEYFDQTDDEKANGYPVVMPFFDRQTCFIPKTQITFIDLFIHHMVDLWNAFSPMPEIVDLLHKNVEYWKKEMESANDS